jgi:hypothetical protein
LPLYLEHSIPRPNLIYLPNTNPPTLVFSLGHGNLLFLATSTTEIEPLLVLEFLHRIVDAFEDFLGAPLLAVKIESNYDVVAQLLTEMCDAGTISTTEPNALREVVEVEGWMGKLLGSINLPGYEIYVVALCSQVTNRMQEIAIEYWFFELEYTVDITNKRNGPALAASECPTYLKRTVC